MKIGNGKKMSAKVHGKTVRKNQSNKVLRQGKNQGMKTANYL
jgi:hypothetical protein